MSARFLAPQSVRVNVKKRSQITLFLNARHRPQHVPPPRTTRQPWRYYLLRFFLPTLIGNIIGGVSPVAFLNHAQVVARKETKRATQLVPGDKLWRSHASEASRTLPLIFRPRANAVLTRAGPQPVLKFFA
jgi:hypothetical protein